MREINNDKKLGRGLSALLGDNSKNKNPAKIVEDINTNDEAVQLLPLTKIIAGVYQPRKYFDQEKLEELSESIRENGIIQPIIVRSAHATGTFEIVAGERRFKAAQMAGLPKVPVIIKDINNIQALEFAIIENVQRADLSTIEEAQGYKQLMNEFDYTQDQVAKKIGCSRSHIANVLRLLSLPEEVQIMLDKGQITFGHAKAIINNDDVLAAAKRIVDENLTVRDAEIIFNGNGALLERSGSKSVNKKQKDKAIKNQSLANIEKRLTSLFDNKVKAEYNPTKKKGKIIIFYSDLAAIERLIRKIK